MYCFQSCIKISTSVRFLAYTSLIGGIQSIIDSAVEELVVQHKDRFSELESLEGFDISLAFPGIVYTTNIMCVLVKLLYHISSIHDHLLCIVKHTQVMYNAAS